MVNDCLANSRTAGGLRIFFRGFQPNSELGMQNVDELWRPAAAGSIGRNSFTGILLQRRVLLL